MYVLNAVSYFQIIENCNSCFLDSCNCFSHPTVFFLLSAKFHLCATYVVSIMHDYIKGVNADNYARITQVYCVYPMIGQNFKGTARELLQITPWEWTSFM